MDTFEDARNEHFRGLVGRMAASVPVDTDVLTERRRWDVRCCSARERVVATASRARGVRSGRCRRVDSARESLVDAEFKIELLHPISGPVGTGQAGSPTVFKWPLPTSLNSTAFSSRPRCAPAFDVGRITPDWRGLGHLDALHRATRFSVADLCRYVEWHRLAPHPSASGDRAAH